MIAATSCCAGRASPRRRLEPAVLRDPVGGDRDVHDDVGDADLVDEVAERAELGDELGLERAEGRGADRALAERAAQRDEVERSGIHLVVGEPAEQAPLRHLGAAQPRPRRRALERELGADRAARARGRGRRRGSPRSRAARRRSRRRRSRPARRGARARACGGGRAGCRHPLRRRAQRGRGIRARAIALRPRLDRGARRHPRVERGDVRADAARRHAEGVGERRRRRPLAVAHEERQEPVLSRSGHGHLARGRSCRRPPGRHAGAT